MLYYLAIPLVGVAYYLTQWNYSGVSSNGADFTCNYIDISISAKSAVFYPGSPQYMVGSKHWIPNASQRATCVVQPGSTEDVATIMQILGSEYASNTPFAIKSGGHTFNQGFSSTTGVLISLSRLNEVTYNRQSKSVTLGMGGIWTTVFGILEKQGVTVSGGRIDGVGVGGYLLGGGYSYLSDASGLSMDNVISYEVVLPNATVTTASDTFNSELFWGLKGGFNNFGIVTKAVVKAFPLGKVWGGEIVFSGKSLSLLPAALEQYAAMQNSSNPVSVGGIVCIYRWAPGSAPAAIVQVFYDGTNPPKRFLSMFDNIPHDSSTLQVWTYTDMIAFVSQVFANPTSTRAALTTVSISTITATVVTQFMDIMANLESTFPGVSQGVLMFEPFVPNKILRPDYDGVFPHNVFASPLNAALWWEEPKHDAAGMQALDIAANAMQAALRNDLQPVDTMMLYPNYADANHPIEQLYGPNVARAKALRQKIDPKGVMLRTGGWKFV